MPIEKPTTVVLAVKLNWIALAVGGIKVALDREFLFADGVAFTIFILACVFAFLAWLNVKIDAGRNWARIVSLVMFVLGTVPAIFVWPEEFGRSFFLGLLSLAQAAMQAYALYLLFVEPGKAWFRKPPPEANPA